MKVSDKRICDITHSSTIERQLRVRMQFSFRIGLLYVLAFVAEAHIHAGSVTYVCALESSPFIEAYLSIRGINRV